MPKIQRTLVTFTFKGSRFEDHGIDLDVLPDLVAYKTLLAETAKELWRRHHPGRRRLPKNFEESLSLKFFEVQPGSATVPLVREIEYEGQEPLPEALADELDQAITLVAETMRVADDGRLLPEEFPKSILPRFGDYGKTLRPDESFEVLPAAWQTPARYTGAVRERLSTWADGPYEDLVDLVATVTMARVTRPRMALLLDDGTEVEAPFAAEQEDAVITALKQHATARLRVRGRGQFSGAGTLVRLLETHHVSLLPEGEIPYDYSAKPIWEEIDELIQSIPPEEFDRLPVDGAEQHDHYIYGTPKRPK
jgi:hypothetical protein